MLATIPAGATKFNIEEIQFRMNFINNGLTLYLPRFLTVHVNTASLPAGYETFCMMPSKSGSISALGVFISVCV
jgi:hypothetical protein